MPYTPIIATLGYVLSEDRQQVLMIHRDARPDDLNLRGTISWPGFGKHGEDWFAFIFVITGWRGTALTHNPEGALEWVPVQRVLDLSLNLWPGDRYYLSLVFS